MTDRTAFAVCSLGAVTLFLGLFARKVWRDLAHSHPALRGSEFSLSLFAGLVLAFQLLPLWVGIGFVGVIVRHIALAVSTVIHRH